ncbi:MAG: DUF4837 family protein [Alistipes sp.]|nr:DUF4837 family protein [Candidatus Alistipes equi]
MKHLSLWFVILSFAFFSCGAFDSMKKLSSSKKVAQGAPYELLVVANAQEWESSIGEQIRNLFSRPIPIVDEPSFTIMRVTADDFKNILPEHRNILLVSVSPKVKKAAAIIKYDVISAPQIQITLQAPSLEEMLQYLNENGDNLLQVFEIAERNRTIKYAQNFSETKIQELIKEKFGINMLIPKGYTLRSQSDNFVWISYEFPTASQGFFIYSYKYTGQASLSRDRLIQKRSEFASRIPGPADGSFMSTVREVPNAEDDGYVPFEADYATLRISSRPWIEMRGLWDVENYFMGGPFVSYTTVYENNVVTLDCYVYSPKHPKRNYLRPLEHLVFLMDFPKH